MKNEYNDTCGIRKNAYAKYQLRWMIDHDYSISDIIERLSDMEAEESHEGVGAMFQEWSYDTGFDGELWVCYEEFLASEYRDKSYMRQLLRDDEYAQYLNDVGNDKTMPIHQDILSVNTPLGRIYAQYNGNTDYPGILVCAGRTEDFADTPGCLLEYTPDWNRIQMVVYEKDDEPKHIITVIDGQQNKN